MFAIFLYHWFCHAERKRSIYGIAQQSNISTLREILHYVQNDVVMCAYVCASLRGGLCPTWQSPQSRP